LNPISFETRTGDSESAKFKSSTSGPLSRLYRMPSYQRPIRRWNSSVRGCSSRSMIMYCLLCNGYSCKPGMDRLSHRIWSQSFLISAIEVLASHTRSRDCVQANVSVVKVMRFQSRGADRKGLREAPAIQSSFLLVYWGTNLRTLSICARSDFSYSRFGIRLGRLSLSLRHPPSAGWTGMPDRHPWSGTTRGCANIAEEEKSQQSCDQSIA
jgi:hypothetical protein